MKRSASLSVAMTVREAQDIAGSIGKTSKMPGPSYGLSAKYCKTGSELRGVPGSVCSSCYAENAFYASWAPVAKGHSRRMDSLQHPRWVDAMVVLISHAVSDEDPVFRWHDSGDLQGVWHLANIVEVCRRLPDVRFWLPTREYAMVAEHVADVANGRHGEVMIVGPKLLAQIVAFAFPSNLCVRLSAHMIDTEPVLPAELAAVLSLLPTSTVHTAAGFPVITPRERKGAIECLAVVKRDNICGDCRACWDNRVTNVSYSQH